VWFAPIPVWARVAADVVAAVAGIVLAVLCARMVPPPAPMTTPPIPYDERQVR
jgi:nitric oxide reductase large subunit